MAGQVRVVGLLVRENTEGDVQEFSHDGTADSQGVELARLETCGPLLDGFAPAASNGGRQIECFAQESVADFAQGGFAVERDTGTEFRRSQPMYLPRKNGLEI